jgi:hypothetical protein
MSEKKINLRWGIVTFTVFLVGMARLVPHAFQLPGMFNFSPLGAMALFGAAYFSKRYMAFVLPLLTLWVSNLLIDNIFYTQYYSSFAWISNAEIYLAFSLIVVLGVLILHKISPVRLISASLSSSLLFFLLTNFFVWTNGTMYAKTAEGLMTCYVAAIPFFWNTLAGDIFYVTLLFGVFEWMRRRYPSVEMKASL